VNTQLNLIPDTEQEKLTPFLKWLGCKTEVAPRLAEIYTPFRDTHTWVEPFCGALGAALGVMPKYALLNDVNRHLINLYRQVKGGLENEVQNPFAWVNDKEHYYKNRHNFNEYVKAFDCLNPRQLEKAALHFYYLNRTGYRGLCRFSKKTGFNVPWGKYKNPIVDHDFALYQKAFKDWTFCNSDYGTLLFGVENGQTQQAFFIYADPPYDDGFVNYSGDFTWEDQVKLAETLAALNCPVVASNKATDRIQNLYKSLGFDIEIISVKRKISCKGDRSPVDEILATKNV
jgi:DNA adenine methylase